MNRRYRTPAVQPSASEVGLLGRQGKPGAWLRVGQRALHVLFSVDTKFIKLFELHFRVTYIHATKYVAVASRKYQV